MATDSITSKHTGRRSFWNNASNPSFKNSGEIIVTSNSDETLDKQAVEKILDILDKFTTKSTDEYLDEDYAVAQINKLVAQSNNNLQKQIHEEIREIHMAHNWNETSEDLKKWLEKSLHTIETNGFQQSESEAV